MIIGGGASGNVFSYNYSIDKTLCDISVHGHYTYMNLFEGNDVACAWISDCWGPTGPYTTFFRNRIREKSPYGDKLYAVSVFDSSHDQNIIGNSLLVAGIDVGSNCRRTWLEKNVLFSKNASIIKGLFTADFDNHVGEPSREPKWNMPASLYLSDPPHFWGSKPWPAIGADVDIGKSGDYMKLPAEERYKNQ